MLDIRRLSCFKKLKEMGFVEIRFLGPGKKVYAIGAALQRTVIDMHDKKFQVDIICIEPMGWSTKERYKIEGVYVEPYSTYYKDNLGRKKFAGMKDGCHTYVKAIDILKKIAELKTTQTN